VKAGIAKLHHRIANIRKDFLHQSSNEISKNHAVVFVEDLQVRNYVQVQHKAGRTSRGTRWPRSLGSTARSWTGARSNCAVNWSTRPSGGAVGCIRATAEHQPHLPGILGRRRSGISR